MTSISLEMTSYLFPLFVITCDLLTHTYTNQKKKKKKITRLAKDLSILGLLQWLSS